MFEGHDLVLGAGCKRKRYCRKTKHCAGAVWELWCYFYTWKSPSQVSLSTLPGVTGYLFKERKKGFRLV